MTQAQQPEALRLTDNLEGNRCHRAAAMLRTQHARIAELEAAPAAQAVEPVEVELPDVEDMAHSALEEALSGGVGHDVFHRWMRAVMDKTVAALRAAPAPAAVAVPSGTVAYTDGTTATGPGNLPQVSPRQQRAAALIDSVEALLGGANGPTIQLRALLAAPAPAAVAVPVPPLTPDEARQAARTARLMSGPSDATQPTEYAMAGALALAAKLAATPPAQAQSVELEALRDMLDTARTDLELLREALGVPVEPHQSLSERMLEAAQAQDVQRDAERYRWLRENATRSGVNIDIGAGVEISDTLDAAIDAAIAASAAQGEA